MRPEFGGKWDGTEFFNTRFPLPTLLCAGYSVKLILIDKQKRYTILITRHHYRRILELMRQVEYVQTGSMTLELLILY